MPGSRAVVLVGKAPEPGLTKTRLMPPLTPAAAANLYEGFLLDCIDLALGLEWEQVSLIYPRRPNADTVLRRLVPPGVDLVEQPGIGLQAALTDAFARHFARGFERVVLIGSDNPTLPAEVILDSCAMLAEHDVVIGPSTDGGYYLMALTQPHPGLFERITWSTEVVYAETLERAATLGLSVLPMPLWYDVDTIEELRRLSADLHSLPSDVARHTRERLAHMSGSLESVERYEGPARYEGPT
jgi:rSAM/selenodomain-associated transferase 1